MSKCKNKFLLALVGVAVCVTVAWATYDEYLDRSFDNPTIFETGISYINTSERICLTGDMGYGNAIQHTVAAAMVEQGCTDIRFLGDIIYPSGITSADDPLLESNFLVPYQALMQQASRIALVLGNHDYKGNVEPWLQFAQEHGLFFPSLHYAEHSLDGICIISLDTTPYTKVYRLLDAYQQTVWLENVKESLGQRCKFTAILTHDQYRSVGNHGNASSPYLRHLISDEVIGDVDLYISGHVHILEDAGSEKNTRFLVSGAGGSNTGIRSQSDTSEYASPNIGFVMVNFTSDDSGKVEAHYAFYELSKPTADAPQSTAIGITHSGRVAGAGLR